MASTSSASSGANSALTITITLLPASEMVDDLESGRLCRVLTDWQGPDREAFAIWPTGRLLSARAKCLRDFMQAHIGRMPVLQGQVPVCIET